MLRFLMTFILLVVALGTSFADDSKEQVRGLDGDGRKLLAELMKLQTDSEKFIEKLDEIGKSGKYFSVVVLTHAMIQLPWQKELAPKSRSDDRMPKVAVERVLDKLVAASAHEQLSAKYFRALLKNEGDVAEASKALLDWTLENEKNMHWDGERFEFRAESK